MFYKIVQNLVARIFVCSKVRKSHRRCSIKIYVLKNFAKLIGKFVTVTYASDCNFIWKGTLSWKFSYDFCEVFNNVFLHKTFGHDLLKQGDWSFKMKTKEKLVTCVADEGGCSFY